VAISNAPPQPARRLVLGRAWPAHYDPWRELVQNWPGVDVVVEPMTGDLLGELRNGGRLIALRAGTSAAQRRCTLAHELVHLRRGVRECGPWSAREEHVVHSAAARRLISLPELARALRERGGDDDPAELAATLEVDRETLALRLADLSPGERAVLGRQLAGCRLLWTVA